MNDRTSHQPGRRGSRGAAGIDLGSNMFRMALGRLDGTGRPELQDKSATVVAIAEGLWSSGTISEAALARARAAIRGFRRSLDESAAREIRAVATGAFRRAANAGRAIAELSELLRAPIEVIDGAREAELAIRGVRAAERETAKCGLVDVGGVSTEYLLDEGGAVDSVSIEIGVITLTERCPASVSNPSDRDHFYRDVALRALEPLRSLAARRAERVFATGGATVALIAHRDGASYCTWTGDGSPSLARADLDRLYRDYSQADPKERARRIGISEAHGNLVPAGFAILSCAMDLLAVDALVPTGRGVAEGALIESLLAVDR